MKIFCKAFAILATFALCPPALAQATCRPTSCTGVIERLYVAGDRVFVSLVGGLKGLNCTQVSGVYVTLPKGHVTFKETYALLLAGKMTRDPVTLRITEGSPDCQIQYVFI